MIKDVLDKYGPIIIQSMREELSKNGSIASSNLYNSLNYEVRRQVDEYILDFESAPYGDFVEKGRKPGKFPPIGPIRRWTQYKGIPVEAAYPIARNIFKFGIKPRPFALPAINRWRDDIIKELVNEIRSETINTTRASLSEIILVAK